MQINIQIPEDFSTCKYMLCWYSTKSFSKTFYPFIVDLSEEIPPCKYFLYFLLTFELFIIENFFKHLLTKSTFAHAKKETQKGRWSKKG
jgi:hypothetical protein